MTFTLSFFTNPLKPPKVLPKSQNRQLSLVEMARNSTTVTEVSPLALAVALEHLEKDLPIPGNLFSPTTKPPMCAAAGNEDKAKPIEAKPRKYAFDFAPSTQMVMSSTPHTHRAFESRFFPVFKVSAAQESLSHIYRWY